MQIRQDFSDPTTFATPHPEEFRSTMVGTPTFDKLPGCNVTLIAHFQQFVSAEGV